MLTQQEDNVNIVIVRDKLKQVILDKEAYVLMLKSDLLCSDYVNRTVTVLTIALIESNIEEMKRILADVEECCK